jgi:hypothetical protein
MIIVKTTNGDRFINEAETLQVNHIKDKAQVEVWPSRWGNQQQQPQYHIIDHVESVIYTTNEEKWKDEGSELEKLNAMCEEMTKWGDNLRKEYMNAVEERDMLKYKLTNLENRIKTAGELKIDKKSPLNFLAISPMGGDCTQSFEVDGCDKMTVYDFIMEVIKRDRYVELYFKREGSYLWHARYNEQRPQPEDMEKKPEDIHNMLVKSARCNGGWGQMSYDVILYDS